MVQVTEEASISVLYIQNEVLSREVKYMGHTVPVLDRTKECNWPGSRGDEGGRGASAGPEKAGGCVSSL